MSSIKKTLFSYACFCLLSIFFTSCFFNTEEPLNPNQPIIPSANLCPDLPPVLESSSDSLVTLGNVLLVDYMRFYFGDSNYTWNQIIKKNSQPAINFYNEALKTNPHHSGALFAKALALGMLITQDPKLNAFKKHLDSTEQQALFSDISTQVNPKSLLKLTSQLKTVNPITLTEIQDLIITSFLPRLDSTISALEKVFTEQDFTFNFIANCKKYQIDGGDIGPFLASLKITKAWMLIVAGFQWDTAQNGRFDFLDTLRQIKTREYDDLSPGKIAALDYLTRFYKPESNFSILKPDWKNAVHNIPQLLLSAIEDAQKGLRYAIAEGNNPSAQVNDLYVVGTTYYSDVDPKDLQRIVDLLERTKKYLTGEELLTYNNGGNNLKVNFAKVFQIDGLQNYMPYFIILPYIEWNDTLSIDTATLRPNIRLKAPFYFTDAQGQKTLDGMDLKGYDDSLSALKAKVIFRDPTFGGVFPDLNNENIWTAIHSLGKIQLRVFRTCEVNNPNGVRRECLTTEPDSPSDLDILYAVIYWQDNMFQQRNLTPLIQPQKLPLKEVVNENNFP